MRPAKTVVPSYIDHGSIKSIDEHILAVCLFGLRVLSCFKLIFSLPVAIYVYYCYMYFVTIDNTNVSKDDVFFLNVLYIKNRIIIQSPPLSSEKMTYCYNHTWETAIFMMNRKSATAWKIKMSAISIPESNSSSFFHPQTSGEKQFSSGCISKYNLLEL